MKTFSTISKISLATAFLSVVLASPAMAISKQQETALMRSMEGLIGQVAAKCDQPQQESIRKNVEACIDFDTHCKGFTSERCEAESKAMAAEGAGASPSSQADFGLPCVFECLAMRIAACADEINAELPACGITDRVVVPEETMNDDQPVVLAPGDAPAGGDRGDGTPQPTMTTTTAGSEEQAP